MGALDIKVDASDLVKAGKAIRAEEDGKALRKDLIKELKAVTAPGVDAVKGKLQAMPHTSGVSSSPPLGSYLASKVVPQVRLSGRTAGVAIKIKRTPELRGFQFAAKRLNRDTWRHKVFGHDVWVEQTSPIKGFFDDTLTPYKRPAQAAVVAALDGMARRIASRRFSGG